MKIILSSDPSKVIEEANFPYSSIGRALEKQIKTFEGQKNVKQVGSLNNNDKNFYHKDKFEKFSKKYLMK